MDWEPDIPTTKKAYTQAIRQSKPLVRWRNTEALLRRNTVALLAPIVPLSVEYRLRRTSKLAEESLSELAEIDLDTISDTELQPARILIGLSFVGFAALSIAFLLLYLSTLHPELNSVAQIQHYWYQYIWFVCLGVAGLFLLGREAMRSHCLSMTSPQKLRWDDQSGWK
ncbi:hypothetical protein [Gloeocapsopsis dulcis]|uniref:Uncharacterized protein n=1 Tax=Gloeocapsopsis dulcis AAB1 = 1H9 TaxID=1433147 RepID=A0A6N8FU26_9CHRO|nr:hypothetical protein [Gloeocapsopsis dulcis]MUL35446.1 hypothetical protein [Gloeocapsopsis dulcis AAB1 = 1H9]WNN90356.1 hypothetical protein P0S91_04480 [Gloeocapsopsis dulcis]